jgi:hypothetical protein
MLRSVGVAYRDKKVVGVFVRFRAPALNEIVKRKNIKVIFHNKGFIVTASVSLQNLSA